MPTPAIPSNRAFHKRPRFTAKAQSSPSPRTRKEVPGADPPIANRKNSGTVPSFVSGDLNKPPSSSVWARTSQQPRLPTPAIPSNRAVHKLPKFTAKAPSSPSPRTRRKAPGADPPIANRQNAGTVPAFCRRVSYHLLLGCISQNAGYSQSPMHFRRPSNWQELQKLIMFSEFQMLAKRHSSPS